VTGCADAVLLAVRREVEQRRALLDAAVDLGEVTIRVKLQAGTSWVRGTVWEEERVCLRRNGGPLAKDARDTVRP
jgi:hypothetical protein